MVIPRLVAISATGPVSLKGTSSIPYSGSDLVPFNKTGPIAEIATNLGITVYDAAYMTLAQKLGTKAYTADGNLLDSLEGEYSTLAEHIRTYS